MTASILTTTPLQNLVGIVHCALNIQWADRMSTCEPISVLFVCLGNICRSPMAEGVFRSLTKSNDRVGNVDSAGTGAYHTLEPPDPRTTATLRKKGITDYDHGARQVEEGDFSDFDYIFAMDRYNLRDLERMRRRAERKGSIKAQVMLYGKFSGEDKEEEVADPYYGRDNGFDVVYAQVTRFARNFLKEVVDKQDSTSG
jgi:low molecular weight phosphotyrosine protein phosphatase